MNDNEEYILDQFNKLKPYLQLWGHQVDQTLINSVLKTEMDNGAIKIPPSFRIKDDFSYLVKALYRKKTYLNPIVDIEDKVGTRIVVLKSSDITDIANKILSSKNWLARITKDIKNNIELEPKIFDYQSIHIIIQPLEDSVLFPGIENSHLTCEIQIRTLLQHAFAEISHDSAYKGPYKNDSGIIRHLAKSMALMEATDDYFCDIFKLMSDEQRYFRVYLKELERIYKEFVPAYDKRYFNLELTDNILGLLQVKDVNFTDLEAFVERQRLDLQQIFQYRTNFIFEQPISILIQYYFFYHRSFLEENWPLNDECLKSIFFTNNTSSGVY